MNALLTQHVGSDNEPGTFFAKMEEETADSNFPLDKMLLVRRRLSWYDDSFFFAIL